MNILFLASTLPRYKNDQQAPFVLEQAIAWKKERPNDNVIILAPDHETAQRHEVWDEVTIYRFSYFWPRKFQSLAYPAILPNIRKNKLLFFQIPFYLLSEFFATMRLVKKNKIDLIYAHWVMPQGFISYLVHKFTKVKYVLQNHSSDLRVFTKMPLFGLPLARKIIRSARLFFCVNKNQRTEALSIFKESEHESFNQKIVVFPMGVHLTDRTPPKEGGKRPHDFGLIGRLSKKKGFDLFLKAAQLLKDSGIAFDAALAGDGEEKDDLIRQSEGLNIDFWGFVSEDKKTEFFQQTKFFIFPSTPAKGDVEGLPVALLEALYSGKMVIASRATNIELLAEWDEIKDGVLLLKDPHDIEDFKNKLRTLLEMSDSDVAVITDKVKSIIKKYKWEHLIKEYTKRVVNVVDT